MPPGLIAFLIWLAAILFIIWAGIKASTAFDMEPIDAADYESADIDDALGDQPAVPNQDHP